MRNFKTFKRDTYILNLVKEVSVFLMIASALFTDFFMAKAGLSGLVLIAIVFMFIPRSVINNLLDRDEHGSREKKQVPEWKIKYNIFLQIAKFLCLITFVLYIFMHETMMAFGGETLWYFATAFMVIPRKLIYIIIEDTANIEKKEANY